MKWLTRSAIGIVGVTLFVVFILTVVAFLAVTGTVCPMTIERSGLQATRVQLEMIQGTVETYRQEKGHYPADQDEFLSLGGEYIKRHALRDGYGNDFVYRLRSGGSFEVYSRGKNGLDEGGAGDDIVIGKKSYTCADYGVGCFDPCRSFHAAAMMIALASLFLGVLLGIYRLALAAWGPGEDTSSSSSPSRVGLLVAVTVGTVLLLAGAARLVIAWYAGGW